MTIAGRPKRSFTRPATMPITSGCQPAPITVTNRRTVQLVRLFQRLLADLHFDRPAFLVEAIELDGDPPRFFGIGGRSSRTPRSDLPTRPPALSRGLSAKPRSRQLGGLHEPSCRRERAEADVLASGHDLQARRHERAIERVQPCDVRDRPEATRSSRSISFGSSRSAKKPRPLSSRTSAAPSRKAIPTAAR